jgi:hypothetical protein
MFQILLNPLCRLRGLGCFRYLIRTFGSLGACLIPSTGLIARTTNEAQKFHDHAKVGQKDVTAEGLLSAYDQLVVCVTCTIYGDVKTAEAT